jgi:electron transport complex protein RnfC
MSILLNLLGPRRDFEGGLFLAEHKTLTARRPIETLRPAKPLHVPLRVQADLTTEAIVKVGDRVLRGQPLSRPVDEDAVGVFAPTSGRIVGVKEVWTALDGELPGVILEPDGKDQSIPREQSWQSEGLLTQLAGRGVVCPKPRMSAHALIRKAASIGVSTLIVNGMETEPYLAADLRTMVETPGRLIDATCEIADGLGVGNTIFALPFRHRRVVGRIEGEARGRHIDVAPLSNKYPQCHPIVLIKMLLDEEIAPGQDPLDAGILVLPLTMIRAAADALLDDRPATHAVLTVSGDAVQRPGVYRVCIGTSIADLAEHVGLVGPVRSLIWGGPFTGVSLTRTDTVVTSDAQAVLLFKDDPELTPIACVNCGWCVEDCPVGLNPMMLMNVESQAHCDSMQRSHLQACIDCGLCSHVCPSHLPLAATIKRSRWRLVEGGASREMGSNS